MHSYQGARRKEILGRNRSRRKDFETFSNKEGEIMKTEFI
jgi:hypothetical protein